AHRLRRAAVRDARGGARGGHSRRARDLREAARGGVEARAGAAEDRRGHARQALLRRERARRAAVDPRPEEDRRRSPRGGGAQGARVRALRPRRVTIREEESAVAPRTGKPAFQRVLLKLSGEALMGDKEFGLDLPRIEAIGREIVECQEEGVQIAIVIGAGNIYRGMSAAAEGMDRATADYAGMLATLLNALALQDVLERLGAHTRILSAIGVAEVAEPYIRRRGIRHLEKGRIVIFAAGTGNPFFTTDTAAALRALEIGADAILMAKHGVDGVYDADPRVEPTAELLPELTHLHAIERGLEGMDVSAVSLCMENGVPIHVFGLVAGNIKRVLSGEKVGTIIRTPDKEDS